MGHQFAAIAFTNEVKQVQQEQNSRAGYTNMEQGEDFNYLLSQHEADFIQARDSFYMASVSETNWPYVQHRGGPAGFMRVLDEKTLGFADFSGNRQYVSTGNFRNNDRVSIIFMDYPNRTRMKLLGRISVVPSDDWETLSRLEVTDYRASVERGFLIHIEAFDWNCPQHITPRYTEAHIQSLVEPLLEENQALKKEQSLSSKSTSSTTDKTILGEGPLELVMSGIRQLTPRIRAFELRDPNGLDLPEISAGAHLKFPVILENGELSQRHYSICSNPARRDVYEIAVLREETGTGGSIAMHNNLQLEQRINCDLPQNHFELHQDNRPAVLFAGGIGITPIKSMAQSLKARNVKLNIHYAGRSTQEMAFRDRLQREFGENLSVYSSADNSRMDIAQILSSAASDAIFYICGPERLINTIQEEAKKQNISPERIRFEQFNASVSEDAKPVLIQLHRSDTQIEVAADQTILDAMLDADISVPFSCKTGNCKTCAVKILDGEADHKDSALTDAEKSDGKLMCPCVSRATTEHLVLDI